MVAAVVGYGPGVGHETALAFGKEGLRVALFSRNPAKHQQTIDALSDAGIQVKSWAMDAGEEQSVSNGLQTAAQELGPLSVLVYNAVAFRMALPSEITPDELVSDFKANVAVALAATRSFLKLSAGQDKRTILLTGGGWSLHPDPSVASTAIGKAGLRHLALMLHDELKQQGVRVSIVTILGAVERGTPFDPAAIARQYIHLYRMDGNEIPAEIQFTGEASP